MDFSTEEKKINIYKDRIMASFFVSSSKLVVIYQFLNYYLAMENLKMFLESKKGQILIRIAISILIGLSIFFGFYFGKEMTMKAATDGTSVAGIVLLSLSTFSLMSSFGFFDFASYGFISVFSSLRRSIVRPYDDLIDYKQKMASKREKGRMFFTPYLVIGLIFLIVGIVLSFGFSY